MAKSKSIYSSSQERLQKLLKQVRADAGITQVALAGRLEKPQSFVSKYESGERRLDLIELRKVCHCLGIPLGRFVKKFEDAVAGVDPLS